MIAGPWNGVLVTKREQCFKEEGSYTKAALGEGREGGGARGPHVF